MTCHHPSRLASRILTAAALAFTPVAASAGEVVDQPWVMRGNQHILVGVMLDEAAVRAALPAGLDPAIAEGGGVTGGLNVYTSQGSDTVAPYTRSYVWADLEGYDSLTESKGRFVLWAATSGSTAKLDHLGYEAEVGDTALSRKDKWLTGTTTAGGEEIMVVVTELSDDPCGPAAGALVYPSMLDGTGPMVAVQYSWSSSTVCGAAPIAVQIMAGSDHPLGKFQPTALTWAAFGDGLSIGASPPFPVGDGS
jgi:hypothetical protein